MKKLFRCIFALCLLCAIDVYASPANDSFLDDNLYKCIIDSYNLLKNESKDYSYSILAEELNEIENLDCSKYSGKIEDLTGLNKMLGLKTINLSGNTFLGGSSNIKVGENSKLKSKITLPPNLNLTDIKYEIVNPKKASVKDGVVTGLSSGSTYIIMTAKISNNEIKEKYLVSVLETNPLKKSNNANLSSLTLTPGNIEFKSELKKYTTIVSKETTSIVIKAILANNKASFVSGYGPRTVNLNIGYNDVLIKVKAEDGTINTYTIGVVRSDGNNANTYLSDLILSVGKINFSRDVFIYTLTVSSDVDKIDIKPVTESYTSKAVVSDTKLKEGENKITITVTAENGSTKNYELIVNKEEYESEKNYLKDLKISGYDINFSKKKQNYEIKINNESSLDILATPNNSTATVSITGNKNLKNNSKVTIKVVDEDNKTRETRTLATGEWSFETVLKSSSTGVLSTTPNISVTSSCNADQTINIDTLKCDGFVLDIYGTGNADFKWFGMSGKYAPVVHLKDGTVVSIDNKTSDLSAKAGIMHISFALKQVISVDNIASIEWHGVTIYSAE